jgi:esterase/lipase superfamily enzyme
MDVTKPVGEATEAIVATTRNPANEPAQPVETEKSVKTETDDVTVTETVTETPVDNS